MIRLDASHTVFPIQSQVKFHLSKRAVIVAVVSMTRHFRQFHHLHLLQAMNRRLSLLLYLLHFLPSRQATNRQNDIRIVQVNCYLQDQAITRAKLCRHHHQVCCRMWSQLILPPQYPLRPNSLFLRARRSHNRLRSCAVCHLLRFLVSNHLQSLLSH